jgi:hypothetical protein
MMLIQRAAEKAKNEKYDANTRRLAEQVEEENAKEDSKLIGGSSQNTDGNQGNFKGATVSSSQTTKAVVARVVRSNLMVEQRSQQQIRN